MKIAFITDRVYPLYTGGYEYLIYNISQKLSQYYDVYIFTSLNENYKKIGNVKYCKISKVYKYTNSKGIHNIKDSIKFILKLLLNIKKLRDFDIIFLNTIPYFYFGHILRKLKGKRISIFHEAWYSYLDNSNIFFKFIIVHEIGKIVNHSDAIIAVSSATEKSLITNYKAKNVYRIPIGINIDDNDNKQNIKYDLVYLGRLTSIKHIENLLLAIKNIKTEFPKISCVIAGFGDQSEHLINLSQKLGIMNNISFIGYIKDDDKYFLLRSCKIFVMPSEREGFSIATLEAMYCGAVPIIAKPEYDEIFGAADFVINNETGLYYKVGDVNELSNKILFLLTNEEIYNKLRIKSMEMSKRFDWKYIIKLYNDVLYSILKS
ncbi:glycosyltransferase family 4 protein [Cuniculiplasma sp. SKW4]|uniref:glycosyltransferase family 4 protein n=1 Tax=Cuniculiplasma sp. SKW4 TaxID=3400171 RepID=UPI003FD15F84